MERSEDTNKHGDLVQRTFDGFCGLLHMPLSMLEYEPVNMKSAWKRDMPDA